MLVIWIVAGMFMEASPSIVVLGPLLFPLAKQIGMDPIHFCVFMITTLGLGFITPPFGLNLFVMAGLTRTSITAIARAGSPVRDRDDHRVRHHRLRPRAFALHAQPLISATHQPANTSLR